MKLSDKQKLIYKLLTNVHPKSGQAYLGAIEVLEHKHEDRFQQSANSARHAIALLTRDMKSKEDGSNDKDGQKKKLRKLVDPIGGLPTNLNSTIKILDDEYHSWFNRVSHYETFPDEKEFIKKFSEFEDLLLKMLKPHFDVIKEINQILSSKKPSDSTLKDMRYLIERDTSSYDHFFQNASEDWLPFLIKQEYFDNLQHVIKEGDKIRLSLSTPSAYLARIADKRPKEVLKVILGYKTPRIEERNPIILENFIKAATKIDSRISRALVKKIQNEKWLNVSFFSRLDQSIGDFMVKLSNDGHHDDAISLAKILFDVRNTDPYPRWGLLEEHTMIKDVRTVIDDFWYEEIAKSKLPILAKNNPSSLVSFLLSLLNKIIFLENLGRNQKKSKEDTSIVWRPAIEDHPQNHERDFRSVLVDILRETLESEGEKNIRRLKNHLILISEKNYPFFRRLELHIYRMFPKPFKINIEKAMLYYFDKMEFKHEYHHMLKENFASLSKTSKNAFFARVKRGPDKRRIEIWENNQKMYPDETVELRKKIWTLNKLEPISQFLEGEIKEQYEALIAELGSPEHPDFSTWHSGVHSAEPVTDLAEDMDVDAVMDFVKSYKPKKGSEFPFYDGTKQRFQEYVEKNPIEFSKRAIELSDSDSTFAYSLLAGLRNSLKSNMKIDWNGTISLCKYIIGSVNGGKYQQPKGYNILGSIADLLEEAIKNDKVCPTFEFRDEIWKILISLIPLNGTDDSWENDYPSKNWDSLGISINTTSGKTFHAVLQYALWCHNNLKKDKKQEFVPEVKKILEDYFEQKIKNTISRHAVLGNQLPNLIYFDRDWTVRNLSKIFPHDNPLLKRAAWDAYMYNNVLPWVFKEIISYYAGQIKNLEKLNLVDGRLNDFDQKLTEHVAVAHVLKMPGADILFKHLLDIGHDLILQHCAWVIGRVLKQYKERPFKSLDLDVIRSIWREGKLIHNKEIDWWFTYSPFEKSETIDLFLESLRKTGGEVNFASTIEKELESYVSDFPLKTAECLELIFKSEKNMNHLHAIRGITTKNILRALLQSKDQSTVEKAESLVHFLGTLGFNEYGDLLK